MDYDDILAVNGSVRYLVVQLNEKSSAVDISSPLDRVGAHLMLISVFLRFFKKSEGIRGII
jgi:hypothetical protein